MVRDRSLGATVLAWLADGSHAEFHAELFQPAHIRRGCVLHAWIGVMNLRRGHDQRSFQSVQCQPLIEVPTTDHSREHIHQHGQVYEFVVESNGSDVSNPNLVWTPYVQV